MNYKKIFVIVMDSVGIGYLPDADKYGDFGANTIKHISESVGLNIPTLNKLGLNRVVDIVNLNNNEELIGSYGKMSELSNGKDTLTGHHEMMGIITKEPLITFTDTGFPKELINELSEKTGYGILGNKSASGTEIIKELGEEHIQTKKMIVYTSTDSVLQIAAHEKYFGLDELYRVSKIAREICMKKEYKVGRIIARPFIGESKDTFKRTSNRHDYALSPSGITMLDILKENGYDVIGVGKINDIFNSCGITKTYHTENNSDGMRITKNLLKEEFRGLCFVNLVDFDSQYGHRRDVLGYKNALELFDSELNEFISNMNDDDLLIVTADHGNDPTWSGTDHTREYVPLLVYSKGIKKANLGVRNTFADISATIAENFNIKPIIGKSFKEEIDE